MRRKLVHAVLLAILSFSGLLYSVSGHAAEPYPDKPILLIVPYGAGSTGDVTARIVAQKLQDRLGQRIIIDDRPGASGDIGVMDAMHAKPDGYTILYTASVAVINMALRPNVGFNLSKDFEPISQVSIEPVILLVNPSLPIKTVADLIALAKSKPGQLNFASTGYGTVGHVFGEAFDAKVGVSMTHVPFRDVASAQMDLIAGRVQVFFSTATGALNLVRSGKARALAIGSPQRSPILPGVPTFAEAGVPGLEAYGWGGFLAPKGTPPEIVQRLNEAIVATLADPAVVKQLESVGQEVKASSPDEFSKFIDSEIARWKEIVENTGMKLE